MNAEVKRYEEIGDINKGQIAERAYRHAMSVLMPHEETYWEDLKRLQSKLLKAISEEDEKLSNTAYFSAGTLFIKHNWSSKNSMEEFAPAIEYTNERQNNSTHVLKGRYFSFPKSELPGHKYAFVDAFEKYGNIKFEEIEDEGNPLFKA